MPAAWELVVSWCGEPIRAELLEGKVQLDAGGTTVADVPLPLDARAPLVRGGVGGLALLAVPGATWSVDGAPLAAGQPLQDGVARLALGDLEVALQRTTPAPRLPRFGPMGGSLLTAATFTAAYALVGLTLYTEAPGTGPSPLVPHSDSAATRADDEPMPPTLPPRRTTRVPRWMAAESAPERVPVVDRSAVEPTRVHRRRTAVAPPVEPADGPVDPIAELSVATLGGEIVRVDDLSDEPVVVGPRAPTANADQDAASARRRGDGHGGVGSCDAAHFTALAARHGRQIAIVACAPAPVFGRAPTQGSVHDVVLHERDGSRLAPEVWTWTGTSTDP